MIFITHSLYFTVVSRLYDVPCIMSCLFISGVTRSRAMRSRKIKIDDISHLVKSLSHEIYELSKLLFVTCEGSNALLLCLACQNLKKEKEKKKRRSRSRRGSSKQTE